MYANSSELTVGRLNPSTERPAPRLATPVTFPSVAFLQELQLQEWTPKNKPNLFDLRLKWQYPPYVNCEQAIDVSVFETINSTFETACDLEDLFAEDADGDSTYLLPQSWVSDEPSIEERKQVHGAATHPAVPLKLSNGRPYPNRGDFWDRINQLRLSNIDGFRGYARLPNDSQPLPRVTHARPFFEHLDGMVQFWDTSLDEYIPPAVTETLDNTAQPRKRTKLSPELPDAPVPSTETFSVGQDLPIITSSDASSSNHTTASDPTITLQQRLVASRRSAAGFRRTDPSPPPTGTYRGWRIDSGRQMPNGTRDLLVKALIEVALWPFGFHVDTSERVPPRVEVQKLRISVPLTRRVWRPPTDRIEARMGLVYGPVLGMSARPMTGFDEKKIYGEIDLLREFGALLLLAQERHRMGRTEQVPGKGKWWQEKPRWAGMPYEVPGEYPGLNMNNTNNSSDETADTKSPTAETKEKRLLGYTARREKERQKRRDELPVDMTARQRAIHAYKKFLPATPVWESKAKYMPIGKDLASQWDEVFLISSLNHHVAILKLRIHSDYLNHLEDGTMPDKPACRDWCSPTLQRSRWYDLLVPDERVEFTRGLWGVAAYLSRDGALTHKSPNGLASDAPAQASTI